jgi:hypothetical protein
LHFAVAIKQTVELFSDMSSQLSVVSRLTNNSGNSSTTGTTAAPVSARKMWTPDHQQNAWVRHFQDALEGDVVAVLSITLAARINDVSTKDTTTRAMLFVDC